MSDPVRCQQITGKGVNCRRIPANGEPYCWQHARDWRRGWRALTRNDSILFVLAFAGVFLTLYFGVRSLPLPSSKNLLEHPQSSIKQDEYSVAWDFLIWTDDHRNIATFFFIYDGDVATGRGVLRPANGALLLTITNQRDIPVLIKQYKVAMNTNRDGFVPLHKLSAWGRSIYMGEATSRLSRIEDDSVFLDSSLEHHTIGPHDTIRGWTLFQYPKDTGARFLPEIKVTISDYAGTSYTSPVLKIQRGELSQLSGFLLGSKVDLSASRFEYEDDSQP